MRVAWHYARIASHSTEHHIASSPRCSTARSTHYGDGAEAVLVVVVVVMVVMVRVRVVRVSIP
jgi:hypothetical protein